MTLLFVVVFKSFWISMKIFNKDNYKWISSVLHMYDFWFKCKLDFFYSFIEIQRQGQTQTKTQEAARTITCIGPFLDCYYRKSKV